MYDHTTVQGATFNMRGQLYRGHANTMALFTSPVVNALGSESDDPGSNPGRYKALCPWDVREKKMRSPLLGLAKCIYYGAISKYVAKQKVMISLNDPDDDNAKYFLSAALKLFIMYSDWQAFMVRSVYRIEFDIRLNSFFLHMCVFTWKNSWMFRTA